MYTHVMDGRGLGEKASEMGAGRNQALCFLPQCSQQMVLLLSCNSGIVTNADPHAERRVYQHQGLLTFRAARSRRAFST